MLTLTIHQTIIMNNIIRDLKTPADLTIPKRRVVPHIHQDMYMDDLKKNYAENNVKFEPEKFRVDAIERAPVCRMENPRYIPSIDHVFVDLETDDREVRVVFNTNFSDMYDNAYKYNVQPPIADLQRAYASVGYSDEFVRNLPNRRRDVIRRCDEFDISLM